MRRPTSTPRHQEMPLQKMQLQKMQSRTLYIKQSQALDILKQKAIHVSESAELPSDLHLSLTIDRTALTPRLIASPSADFEPGNSVHLPFAYTTEKFGASDPIIATLASQLRLPNAAHAKLAELVQALWEIFKQKEAFVLEVRASESLEVRGARFGFDDAAFRSSGRQEDIHKLRNAKEEVPEEVEAEKDGIVYVKYVCPLYTDYVVQPNAIPANPNSVDWKEKAASEP